jgi:hypothetical protein
LSVKIRKKRLGHAKVSNKTFLSSLRHGIH